MRPSNASSDIAPIRSAHSLKRRALISEYTPKADMNCVPFSRARPSFDCSEIGFQPNSLRTSSEGRRAPLYSTSPRPSSGRHMLASGARSPEAPSDPCWNTTGSTSLLKKSTRRCTVSSCTPELPYERDWILSSSISFTISAGTRSPVPQACDITRFFCNCESWSLSIEILQSEPKPVVIP